MVRNHDSLAATDAERPNQRRSAEEVGIFPLRGRNGDLRKLPQIERKQALLDLLGENDIELPVLYSEHLIGDGQKMFEHAAKLNWEGIISKRADEPYRSERNENWLKIKLFTRASFRSSGSSKTVAASRPYTLARTKATNSFTWARWERAGLALLPARSGSNSTRRSAPSQS